MSQVRVTNKKTGITYVYESESYWDKEKKQPRNRRKLIGKIDPQTGDVVPTRKRMTHDTASADSEVQIQQLHESYGTAIAKLETTVLELRAEISTLKSEKAKLINGLRTLIKSAEE